MIRLKNISELNDERAFKRKGTHSGKVLTDKTKSKIRAANIGEKNPNFGSMWITDGIKNMKIKKSEIIPVGWNKGRTFNKGYKRVRT